jgi:hypothetical protein
MDAAFMLIKGNAAEPTAAGGAAPSTKPDSGHANTISITHRAHRTSLNAMKPPVPVRSNAVNVRFHDVRPRTDLLAWPQGLSPAGLA